MPNTDEPEAQNHYPPARFWAVDLHVHTPASRDVQEQLDKYGASTAQAIVQAAVDAGLDAIAVTDHNTVDWCEAMATAAVGHDLVVLPGMEISTAEGHMLGIWEVGTPLDVLRDVLVKLGINSQDHGRLDIAATKGFGEAARIVAESNGLAIPAHVDRDKGLLKLSVPYSIKGILLDPAIAAVEVVEPETVTDVLAKLGGARELACIRSSDMMAPGLSYHTAGGIGTRRTWIKASRPDLRGLRHAFEDPSLRVRLEQPEAPQHIIVQSVAVTGGFLDGQTFTFSPDLSCLLGGTGTGKSLLIELIRFGLGQQANGTEFPQVRKEVDSRLDRALGTNGTVELVVQRGDAVFTVRRLYCGTDSPDPEVVSTTAADLDLGLIPIRAFSQSEVIEYARAPVGRMALIDQALDLSDISQAEDEIVDLIGANSGQVAKLRSEIWNVREKLATVPETVRRIDELAEFFDADIVKQQEKWSRERARFAKLGDPTVLPTPSRISVPGPTKKLTENESNDDLQQRVGAAYDKLRAAVVMANEGIDKAYEQARTELAAVAAEWRGRNAKFDAQLAVELAKVDIEGRSLPALKKRLTELQTVKATLDDAATRLDDYLVPALAEALAERESLLGQLIAIRRDRRARRMVRIKHLNRLMAGEVRIKLDAEADDTAYLQTLSALAKGSNLRAAVLQQLCRDSLPVKLVRSYLEADPEGVGKATNVDVKHVERLFEWIAERGLEAEFLRMQSVDLPDALTVEFRVQGKMEYAPIEQLAHGQKCTAILIIAMAEGEEPLIIDQPEDALHAPWIEDHLVDRLRELRGSRQYIFATRSPALVVSADAEMIVTLTSNATSGSIEASGSLERYDLNRLVLYHLEGGARPFKRRSKKLAVSVD